MTIELITKGKRNVRNYKKYLKKIEEGGDCYATIVYKNTRGNWVYQLRIKDNQEAIVRTLFNVSIYKGLLNIDYWIYWGVKEDEQKNSNNNGFC